jgi:hypothetical protein
MSVSIVLVPIALAGIAAWQASRRVPDVQGRMSCRVSTRMRSEPLLAAALADTGASVTIADGQLIASWIGLTGTFLRDDAGIWSAHFSEDVELERAEQIIGAIDASYGRRVQQEVLARIRERAPQAGMHVESEEVEADDTVTVVLNVSAS